MNLTIDIGNTLVKLSVFEGDKLIETIVKKDINESLIDTLFQEYSIQSGIYSTVRGNITHETLLKKYNFLELTHRTPLPLAINYKTPETLGIDRIAAVVGAKNVFENSNLLVIDI